MTRANAAAQRRITHFGDAIEQATGRARLWEVWRWLLAEASRLPSDEQETLAGGLATLAADLNERGAR